MRCSFDSFDELVLLKRGGKLIFEGSIGDAGSDLIAYFQVCCSSCADYALSWGHACMGQAAAVQKVSIAATMHAQSTLHGHAAMQDSQAMHIRMTARS